MDQPIKPEGVTAATDQPLRRGGDMIIRRVSPRRRGEEQQGAWKVAFADFCLALMCLFLVLWLLAVRDKEKVDRILVRQDDSFTYDRDRDSDNSNKHDDKNGGGEGIFDGSLAQLLTGQLPTHSTLADAGKSVDDTAPGLLKHRYESTDDWRTLEPLLQEMSQAAGLAGNLQTIVTPLGLRILLHDTDRNGIFPRGSALPARPFHILLQQLGKIFAKVDNPILIVGHTDAVPYIGYSAYLNNWNLSVHRAMAARCSLMEGGMPAERVLQVIGMADRAPLNAGDSRDAVNRRIEFLVLTPEHARKIEKMFGAPLAVTPLTEGVNAALTEPSQQDKPLDAFGLKPSH